jgi:predicted permease
VQSYGSIFLATLPVFLLILLGMGLRQGKILEAQGDAVLMRIAVNVFMPSLIFVSVVGNQNLGWNRELLLAPALGYVLVVAGVVVAWTVGRLAGLERGHGLRTFAATVGMFNYGYVPIPLVLALFDRNTLGMLFVFNLGVELALWTVLPALFGGKDWKSGLRRVCNSPVCAILAGLAVNLGNVEGAVPAPVFRLMEMLGACAIPIGVILTGAVFADCLHELKGGGAWLTGLLACFIRLGVLPLIFLGAAWLGRFGPELSLVLAVQASMAAALFPLVMARHYGGDVPTALRVIVCTQIVSLATIPAWLHWGLGFLAEWGLIGPNLP